MSRHAIVDELLARGLLNQPQVDAANTKAQADRKPVLRVLVDERMVTEEQVYRVVAEASKLEFVDPEPVQVDPTASGRLPGDWARRMRALPYAWRNNQLLVAVDDPTNLTLMDDLRRLTQADPVLVLAPPAALTRKIGQIYRAEEELDDLSNAIEMESTSDLDADSAPGEGEADAPIVRYVNLLISQAVADRASDIHIEPGATEVNVRYRIDGVLHHQMTSPRSILAGVVSRLKIMADMNIAERRVPQDGRITVTVQGRKVDLRVATLPTVYGEKVVLRILDNSSAPLALPDIGFTEYNRVRYEPIIRRPHGMILVTGPTGSGKSTTLYATLNTVKSPEINIITVEDPVEFRMPGVSQVQINTKAGLTFAAALRSILRADPDVVLVGEIRDRETAQIGIEASLTGHLVLSTLHTNDAASAVTRLVEMGVEPFLVGSATAVVVAQRLVRKLCTQCSQEFTPTEDELRVLNDFPWTDGQPLPTLRRAVGCSFCANTGYRGRTSIHETFIVSEQIERMVNEGAHTDDLRRTAIAEGMRPMRQDGWQKVVEGQSTIEEILRVVV